MTEDVDVRARHRKHHATGHLRAIHPQLGMHAAHDDIELREQVVIQIERAVLEDVDLHPGQDPEGRELFVELLDHL